MKHYEISRLQVVVFFAIAIAMLIVQVYPMFWVVASSLKDGADIADNPPYSLPSHIFWGNYARALLRSRLVQYFVNSVVVAGLTLVGIVFLSAPAAFAISKLSFKGSERVLSFFLLGIMIPIFACIIPMFMMYRTMGLRNTYFSLILPQVGFGLPLCIYLYTSFMRFVPDSLLEAALIDGAGTFQIFVRIMFPMIRNATVTVVIYNFVNIWNEFTYANTFMTKSSMKTLPIGLNDFVGEMGRRDWGATFAAIVLAVLPTLIVYFLLNKKIMEGMVAGAIKE